MSANCEPGRSIYAAWERGDFRSVDWADPEIKYMSVGGPDPVVGRAWRAWLG
jgi:hypothetical protein